MFTTHGIERIATITELRTESSTITNVVEKEGKPVLIQRNGEPEAVLLPITEYEKLTSQFDEQ